MPELINVLQGNDLGFLKMVANAWGVELNAPDAHTAQQKLAETLLEPELVMEIVETLPSDARSALQSLLENDGQMSWALFCRRFGEVRPMGPARRDRERPDLKPVSPAEYLWYRALIGKDFFNIPPEPQELAYIPEDFVPFLLSLSSETAPLFGRPATPTETSHVILASDVVIDQACTYLAAQRAGIPEKDVDNTAWLLTFQEMKDLLFAAHLIDSKGLPLPEPTRSFLEAPRAQALARLAKSWMESNDFNELRLLPGLKSEGDWSNDPLHARRVLLDLIGRLPQDNWWGLGSFVAALKDRLPDFQRPAGDYDSWFIKKESTGAFLRGFATWDEVDGALIRYLIIKPLHALGMVDLAAPAPGTNPTAFRPSAWAGDLWHGQPPKKLPQENGTLVVTSDGRLRLPPLTPRSARYQIARFGSWEGEKDGNHYYRLTPASLDRAHQQGLKISHLLALLKKHAATPLPPTLIQAMEHWEQFGVQASIEKINLLRVTSPEILASLRKTRAARFLGEQLTPTMVVIRPGGEEAILNALAETGFLGEAKLGV